MANLVILGQITKQNVKSWIEPLCKSTALTSTGGGRNEHLFRS